MSTANVEQNFNFKFVQIHPETVMTMFRIFGNQMSIQLTQ